MARWAYLLTAFVTLAAWAGAQGPTPAAPLSAEDKLRLHKANAALIENLVGDGIKISNAGSTVDGAARCRDAARSLVNAIGAAAQAEDAERVAELTGLFRTVVVDGLLPTLADAKRNVAPGSPADRTLGKVREDSAADVSELKKLSVAGKVGDNPRVKKELKQLDELAEQLSK